MARRQDNQTRDMLCWLEENRGPQIDAADHLAEVAEALANQVRVNTEKLTMAQIVKVPDHQSAAMFAVQVLSAVRAYRIAAGQEV